MIEKSILRWLNGVVVTMAGFARWTICVVAVLTWACGDDGDESMDAMGGDGSIGAVSDCNTCGDQSVCVRIFGVEESMACMAIPVACNGAGDCFDEACAAAMYALCGEDFINNGCSDTFPPTVISCNP